LVTAAVVSVGVLGCGSCSGKGLLTTFNPGFPVILGPSVTQEDIQLLFASIPDYGYDPSCSIPGYGFDPENPANNCAPAPVWPHVPGNRPEPEPG
jgi:hypothetical protein